MYAHISNLQLQFAAKTQSLTLQLQLVAVVVVVVDTLRHPGPMSVCCQVDKPTESERVVSEDSGCPTLWLSSLTVTD